MYKNCPPRFVYDRNNWEAPRRMAKYMMAYLFNKTFILGGSKITADGDCSHEIKRCLAPWKESYDQPREHIQEQRHYFVNKGPSSQGYGFSSHGCM